jgi:AGCS family alanine or glycine:cation symporter
MMQSIEDMSSTLVDLVWGLPLVILIIGASIYFSIICRLIPIQGIKHSIDLLRGKYNDPSDPGEISHFQALTSALSGTIGMGNIAGVAVAISYGGPGAVFWMWVAGSLGMITKFFTCTLSCMYREKDSDGSVHGGPMFFIENGLGKRFKPLAIMFAFCGIFGCMPMFQSNQLASLMLSEWYIPKGVTGLVAAIIVGIVVIGGIKRIGKVTSRLVPFMFILYVISSLIVIGSNYQQIPDIFTSIIMAAFGFEPIVGSAVGLTFREILVTGVRRAVFSNEAGVGTEALAHGEAKTREPVREGLVAMTGPFFDTHIVCTLTALVILSSGVSGESSGIVMTANAFSSAIPMFGGTILSMIVLLFSLSTMITLSFYSIKCASYLIGERHGKTYLYFYLILIPVAAIWSQTAILNFMDTAFGLMVIPTLTGTIILAPSVVKEMNRYFRKYHIGKHKNEHY